MSDNYKAAMAQYEHDLAEWQKDNERIDALEKVAHRRNRWKAATARYYESHPEVKEKKRKQMAASRMAKKLAKRRWDPPKKIKKDEQLGDFPSDLDLNLTPTASHNSFTHDELLERYLSEIAELVPSREQEAIESLLQLKSQNDDPGTSEDDEAVEPLDDASENWGLIAPDYESSDSDSAD
ncbi:hypothetical protein DFH09DRAFT_1068671 [Mycena vulgaris]|nr:hypothetical protein DFH09DRAFT_1068671 [Mycena vulgaris]